jgi:hypothetical protein
MVDRDINDIPELIARLLTSAVERRLRRNLTRGYYHRERALTRVRGRINFLETESRQLLSKGDFLPIRRVDHRHAPQQACPSSARIDDLALSVPAHLSDNAVLWRQLSAGRVSVDNGRPELSLLRIRSGGTTRPIVSWSRSHALPLI